MKKILASLCLLFNMSVTHAANIDNIVFFGDSLSDDGNLYKALLHVMPKSPPYFQGRFTNGPTWAEQYGQYLADRFSASYKIYAVGGATAIFHPPTSKFATLVTLSMELDKYYLDSLFRDKSKTLFVIWIGDNDYMFDQDVDLDAGTNKVINQVVSSINSLAEHGAKHFLILNLADASRIPLIRQMGSVEKLHSLVVVHNQKLAIQVKLFAQQHKDIKVNFFDLASVFDQFIDDPSKYNQQYQVNIANTTDACWLGGFFFRAPVNQMGLNAELNAALSRNQNTQYSADVMANAITQMPELNYTYKLGNSLSENNLPCANPENYLFWDDIHPTATVHSVIARVVEESIGDNV